MGDNPIAVIIIIIIIIIITITIITIIKTLLYIPLCFLVLTRLQMAKCRYLQHICDSNQMDSTDVYCCMREFRLPPRSRREPRSSGILRSVYW